MAIQGHLETVTVPEVFSFLSQLRKTGTLCVISGRKERSFVFSVGDLVYATTKDPSKRLGNFLVRLGVVTKEEISMLLDGASPISGYLGEALVESQTISVEELRSAVREQMIEILEETMAWSTGAFHFDDNDVPFDLPSGTLISTQSLLLEVTSKSDERQRVKELFPDGNVIFDVEPRNLETLEERDRAILNLVDGIATVEQILFKSPYKLMDTANSLRNLVDQGHTRSTGVRVEDLETRAVPDLYCLPVAPEVSGKILRVFNRKGYTQAEVLDAIRDDPLLTAKMLKALTTSHVELPRSLLRTEYLVDVLGPFQLRSLLVPVAVRGLFCPPDDCPWEECWEHSVFSARFAEVLAKAIDYPFPPEAYLAGLLHNIGMYILMSQDPAKYRRVLEEARRSGRSLVTVEEEQLGVSHPRIGAVYAEKWCFPKGIVVAINSHHNADEKNTNPIAHIVSVAATMAQESGLGIEPLGPGDDRFDISLKQLRIERDAVHGLLDGVSTSGLKHMPVRPPRENSAYVTARPETREVALVGSRQEITTGANSSEWP